MTILRELECHSVSYELNKQFEYRLKSSNGKVAKFESNLT